MMKALYSEDGASLRIGLMEDPAVTGFIEEHSGILDSGFAGVEMSDTMRSRLEESDYIFSGLKTFHELNEAFPSLLDEDGSKKPFERFLNDVQKVDETYNRNYLRAEYNFAGASAEMAARWENYEKDGDEYYLQYRTAGDDKVRPEHAALNGVTLPMSDPFWDEYYPPNGWNCRCNVVQVLKDTNAPTDRDEAYRRAQNALGKDTKGMFRFNSGKQEKTFPDYNPYTISKCTTCTRKLNLAKGIPDSQLCEACLKIRSMAEKEKTQELTMQERINVRKSTEEWIGGHLPEVTLSNGQKAKRLVVTNDGVDLIVGKRFFSETYSKCVRRANLAETMDLATKVNVWLPSASLIGMEDGKHHLCKFLVYEANFEGAVITCKVKNTEEKIVYVMRVERQKD